MNKKKTMIVMIIAGITAAAGILFMKLNKDRKD